MGCKTSLVVKYCTIICLLSYHHLVSPLPRILSIKSNKNDLANNASVLGRLTTAIEADYIVEWSVDEEAKTITFDVEVATTGFIGLGISPGGGMTGADIVVGWVDDVTGEGHLEDRHGVGQMMPVLDQQQDYKLLEFTQTTTHTKLKFSRSLNTCDEEGDVVITADTTRLIWSYGLTDQLSYHGPTNRGSRTVNLLDPVWPEKPDLSKYSLWELRTNKSMSPDYTRYWCTMHKSPPVIGKHHVVGFDAIIESPEALKHTHHMEAYKCTVPPGMEPVFDSYLKHDGVDCYYPHDESFPGEHCQSIAYGWAIGGEVVLFPDFVGFPLVSGEYFKLEVHYDNPQLLDGISFETGLKLYYTDELREIDAGRFVIASEVNFTQTLPPNSVNFTTVAHCSAKCIEHFPTEGITLFNFLLHSHLSGRKMKVRHFRNNTELPWLAKDDNYDFNYQQTRSYAQHLQLLPGDQLALECTYDTRWKNGAAVIGGHATTDEMCMAFFSYYPAVDTLLSCNSEPPKESILDQLEISEIEFINAGDTDPVIVSPLPLRGLKYSKVIEMINWTDELRATYQESTRFGPQQGYCRPFGPDSLVSYVVYDTEYSPPNECLSTPS